MALRAVSLSVALLGLVTAVSAPAGDTRAQGFDGITVIRLGVAEAANAIRGQPDTGAYKTGDFIAVFVSGDKSYATVFGAQSVRGCVAWSVSGSHTANAIAFGRPANTANQTTVTPKICQPFTLTLEGSSSVRITADNKYHTRGPHDPEATPATYSGVHAVLARIPLRKPNWDLPIFAKYDVKGARLGPAATGVASLKAEADVTTSALKVTPLGSWQELTARHNKQRDQFGAITIYGHIAPAATLLDTADSLTTVWTREALAQESTREAFERAVVERYGEPSVKRAGVAAGSLTSIWLFDMEGRQGPPGRTASTFCLTTDDPSFALAGFPRDTLAGQNYDIGPWGCSLILILNFDGAAGRVTSYRLESASGYALALNQMALRFRELADVQKRIGDLEGAKPRL